MENSGFNKILNNIKDQKKDNQEFLSYDESVELAKNLLEKYKNKIWENHGRDVDGFDNGEVFSDFQKSIQNFLSQIPDDVKRQYEGHGITKGSEIDQVAGALNILANKSIKGDLGELKSDYIGAYSTGNFIVISPKNQKLIFLEKDKSGKSVPAFNKSGAWKANIGAFVIDVKYYPLVEELKAMFPDVNIIKANQLPDYVI